MSPDSSRRESPRRGGLDEPVSILMPVCDEADLIVEVVDEWRRDVLDHLPPGSELVFDDASRDGTEKILARLATEDPRLRHFTHERDGFFNAAMRLYRRARCPLVFFTDSDGQYVAEDFWAVAAALKDHDMAHGYKADRNDPFYRVFASAMFNRIVRALFGSRSLDANSAFRLIRAHLLADVLDRIHCLPMLPNAEMYVRAEALGYSVVNVPVRHRPRAHGKSRSLPLGRFTRECWIALRGLWRLRRDLRDARAERTLAAGLDRRA